MAANFNIGVILRLVDQLSAPLRGVQDRLAQTGAKLTALGGQMSMLGAGGVAAMAKPVLAFAQAEDAATQLRVALMGAGGQVATEFDQINALALRLGNTLPGTTADFQQMMTMLVRQGMAAETILGGTGEAAAKLGVMLKLPASGAAEFAAKLQDATKTSAADMTTLADTIQRTFYLGVDPGNMLGAFSALAPAMAAIRQEGLAGAQAMAPLIAMLDQAGLSGGSAGNALRKVFQGGFDAKNMAKANDALREFGISLDFLDQGGEFAGLDNLFAQLQKLQGLTTETRLAALKEIWGDDSETLQAISTLIDKGQAGYEEVATKLAGQADLNTRVNAQLGTLANLWDAASGTFVNTLAAWAGAIAPELKAVAEWFGRISQAVAGFIERHPALAKWTAGVVAFGSAALVLGGALSLAAGGVMTLLAPLAALASPIGLVVAAGAALVALNWDAIVAWIPSALPLFSALWAGLVAGAQTASTVLAQAASQVMILWEPISGFFTGLWQGLIAGLAPLQPAFAAAWSGVTALLEPVIAGLGSLFGWISQLLAPIQGTGAAAMAMGQAWGAAIASILTSIAGLPAALASAASQMFAIGASIVQGLWDGWKSKWEAFKAWVAGLANLIPSWLAGPLGVQSPSRVFAEIGRNLMQGLHQGMTELADQPLATARGLAAGLAAVPLALAPIAAPATDLLGGAASLLDPASALVDRATPASALADLLGGAASLLGPASAPASALVERATPASALVDNATAAGERVAAPLGGATPPAPGGPPGVSPPGAAGGRPPPGPVNMTITINVQAPPNTDAQGLATLIEERLRRAAGDAARHLSGLYDDPDEV